MEKGKKYVKKKDGAGKKIQQNTRSEILTLNKAVEWSQTCRVALAMKSINCFSIH